MRTLVLVLAACSSKASPPEPTAPAPMATADAVAPVTVDAAPVTVDAVSALGYRACAQAALPARDKRDVQRVSGNCRLRNVTDVTPERDLAAVLGRPLSSEEDRVVVLEAASRARFDALVRCDDPPRIDFAKQHVRLVVVYGMGTGGRVSAFYDDGKTATLVVYNSSRSGCGGREYGEELHLDTVLVPADRAVEIMPCAVDPHCTGDEK